MLLLHSLLTDVLVAPSDSNLNSFIVLKFLLASAHIVFEPIVILILRWGIFFFFLQTKQSEIYDILLYFMI